MLSLVVMSATRPSMDQLIKQSFQVSRSLFVVFSVIFLTGVSLALVLDVQTGRIPTIINTVIGFIVILTALVLGSVGRVSRNLALGIMVYGSGFVWIAESFITNHVGTAEPINFLSNLVVVTALLAAGGIMVSKAASLGLGGALIVYIIGFGSPIARSFPELEYYLYFFVFVVIGLIFIVFYYRLQLENVVLDLHSTREVLQARKDHLEETSQSTDLSLRKLQAAHQSLAGTDKYATLGALTAGIAQEIQVPVSAVRAEQRAIKDHVAALRNHLETLKSKDGYVDEVLRDIENAAHRSNLQSGHAVKLVDEMIHQRTGNAAEDQDVNELVQEAAVLAYNGMRIQEPSFLADLQYDFDEAAGSVKAVRHDLVRVLSHLLNNAFYAVHQRRLLEPGRGFQPMVRLKTRRGSQDLQISVEDNGTGIPEQIKDKIFEPFFSSKPTGKGTGLGLSIAREIISELYKGSLSVESSRGSLTRFTVALPLGA